MSGNFTYQGYDLKCLFLSEQCIIDNLTGQELWVWGNNDADGSLGDGTTTAKSVPIQTLSGGTNWKQISLGGNYGSNSAIKCDGTLWSWGWNAFGQLGTNTTISSSSPVQTISSGNNWKQVAVGTQGGVISLKTDGTIWVWGQNCTGQLGDSTLVNKSSPIQLGTSNGWKSVSAGFDNTAAIKTDGSLFLWGNNSCGKLGDGTIVTKSSPVNTTAGNSTEWKQIALGSFHTVAVKVDGTIWSWGSNGSGQLGNGNTTDTYDPIQISGTNWKQVSAGNSFTGAIKLDGTLWTWGANNFGQLGSNSTAYYSSPVQTAAGGNNWKQVSLGELSAAAIKTDGTLWTWGYNNFGELGSGDRVYRSSPGQTAFNTNTWRSVCAKWCQTAALKITEGMST